MKSALILLVGLSLAWTPVPKDNSSGKETSFTIDPKGGHLVLPMMVDGKGPLRIVFDTGASESYINPSAYQRYGITSGKKKIKIGAMEFETSNFPKDQQDIPGYDGIMGFDVISRFNFTLNIRERKIIFHDKGSWKAPATAKKVKYASKSFNGRESGMEVNVTINDKGPLHLMIDTGSPAACWLVSSGVQKAGLKVTPEPIEARVKLMDGVETAKGIVMTQSQPNLDQAKQMLGDIDGVLGGNFLKNFVVTFDFTNKEVAFETLPPQ